MSISTTGLAARGTFRTVAAPRRAAEGGASGLAFRIAGAPAGARLARALDLQQPPRVLGLVLDLQGGVVDAEALVEHMLELVADPVAVVARGDEDVRGEGGEA